LAVKSKKKPLPNDEKIDDVIALPFQSKLTRQ